MRPCPSGSHSRVEKRAFPRSAPAAEGVCASVHPKEPSEWWAGGCAGGIDPGSCVGCGRCNECSSLSQGSGTRLLFAGDTVRCWAHGEVLGVLSKVLRHTKVRAKGEVSTEPETRWFPARGVQAGSPGSSGHRCAMSPRCPGSVSSPALWQQFPYKEFGWGPRPPWPPPVSFIGSPAAEGLLLLRSAASRTSGGAEGGSLHCSSLSGLQREG